MIKRAIISLFFMVGANAIFAQISATNSNGQVVGVRPTIMVIPFIKEKEDIRTVIDNREDLRIGISKVKEAFANRGFVVSDFVTCLKKASQAGAFTGENQSDLKSQLIQYFQPDIFVEVDATSVAGSDGQSNSVNLSLTANETSTGNSLSTKTGSSGQFRTNDVAALTGKAVENVVEGFLAVMNAQFDQIIENGKSVNLDISFSQNSSHSMSEVIGGANSSMSALIEDWIAKNCYKNNYSEPSVTKKRMIFNDVHIPLKNQSTKRNYTANQFSDEIISYLSTLKLKCNKDVQANSIYITIN